MQTYQITSLRGILGEDVECGMKDMIIYQKLSYGDVIQVNLKALEKIKVLRNSVPEEEFSIDCDKADITDLGLGYAAFGVLGAYASSGDTGDSSPEIVKPSSPAIVNLIFKDGTDILLEVCQRSLGILASIIDKYKIISEINEPTFIKGELPNSIQIERKSSDAPNIPLLLLVYYLFALTSIVFIRLLANSKQIQWLDLDLQPIKIGFLLTGIIGAFVLAFKKR